MRKLWKRVVKGKPSEPIRLIGEWSNPKEEAILAMAVSLEAQTLLLERFAAAAESMVASLERAEQRALSSEPFALGPPVVLGEQIDTELPSQFPRVKMQEIGKNDES